MAPPIPKSQWTIVRVITKNLMTKWCRSPFTICVLFPWLSVFSPTTFFLSWLFHMRPIPISLVSSRFFIITKVHISINGFVICIKGQSDIYSIASKLPFIDNFVLVVVRGLSNKRQTPYSDGGCRLYSDCTLGSDIYRSAAGKARPRSIEGWF